MATSSYNIIGHQNYGTLLVNGVNGNQVGVMDPGLAPLADNGGPTKTHALLPNSPAIDHANPGTTILSDQRGVTRQGGPEAGAFELESYLSPGGKSFATETITGDLSLIPQGVVKLQIGGPGSGSDYDRLVVNGQATLGGALHLDFTGYQPELGAAWDVLEWSSRTGEFSSVVVSGLDPANSVTATVLYRSTGLRIVIEPAGATIRWDGGAGTGNWHDPANWTDDRLPNSNDVVWLDANGVSTVTLGGDVTVAKLFALRDILLTGSRRLTVTDGGELNRLTLQTSSSFVNGGNFIVRSNLSMAGNSINTSGTLTVEGTMTWTNGSLTGSGQTLINGTLSISGSNSKSLQTHTLFIHGNATLSGTGSVNGFSGSVINVTDGAVLDVQSDTGLTWGSGSNSTINIAPGGVFRKSGGTGITSMQFILNNHGLVDIQTGNLAARGGLSSGNLRIADNSTFSISNGTHTFQTGAIIDSSGLVSISTSGEVLLADSYVLPRVTVSNGTLRHTGSLTITDAATLGHGTWNSTGTLTVAGSMTWTNGTLTGTGQAVFNGSLAITGNDHKSLAGRSVTINGNATLSGTGSVSGSNGGVINVAENAVLNVQSNAGFNWGSGADSTINIAPGGVFRKSGGTGITQMQFILNNHGLVDVGSGRLGLRRTFLQSGGTTSLDGGEIDSSLTINFQSGSIEGHGAIYANVNNVGATVSPGGTEQGRLTISGNYTQGSGAVLDATIGGTGSGEFDQLVVTGTATLSGTLRASLATGFTPPDQSEFPIITAASRIGAFAQSDFVNLPDAVEFNVGYTASSVNLIASVDESQIAASLVSQQLRDGMTATFDALPNWATRFNISEASLDIPMLPGEFADALNLMNVLGPLLSRPAVQIANDWAVFRSELETAGFTILSFPGVDGDVLRVKYTRTLVDLSGNEDLKQESLGNLANLAATVNLTGSFEHAADLQLEFIFGVDADGFFMQGDSGLKLTTVATGNASGAYDLPLVDLDIAASGSLAGLLSVEVTPSDTSRLFRITDVTTPPATWLSTDVDGTVRLNLTQTVQPLDLAFTGSWVATLTDSSHTGTSSDIAFPTTEKFLAKAVPWASHQATSMLGDQVADLLDATSLPLVNGRLPESAEDWHKVGFIAALAPLGLTGYVAVAGTDGIVNYLAQQGIIVEESLDQLKIQNLLAGKDIDFESLLKLRLATDPTRFDPLDISYAPDYTGAGALSGLTLAGNFAASMLPAINLGLGIDRSGFHITADSTLDSTITLSGTTTGTMGPFSVAATLGGTVAPRLPLAPADANQDGKIRPAELIGKLTELRIEQSTFTGELGTDLTLGFLDYVDADGDSTNNSARGGDPFRFSGTLGFSIVARDGLPVFEPDSFDIKNPDVNDDGSDDFTTKVLLQNFVHYGRDQLTDILDVDELQSKLATLGNLVGSNTPIGELFDWNESFSTLDPAKLANLTDVSPGTIIGGNFVVKEIVTFDQIQLWLNFGLPTQPVDLLQLQLNEFTAATESIQFELASLLPQDMIAQGWTASAALRTPTLGGSLGFGVDSSASPFYLATGEVPGDGGPQSQSRLSGAVTVEISLANASLFDGRLVIEQANGQFTPNFAIDFRGTGGADTRLRLNELHQLANADASLFENTLDSLLIRLRGSMFLPGLTDENDDPIEVRVLGTLEGLGDQWSLSGEIASDQRLKLGGFTITELGVDIESRLTGGTRSLTAAVRGELEVALGDGDNPLQIGFTGEITDEALHVTGSLAVDDQLIGPEATPLLWIDGVELTLDMTIPRLANAPIEGGISLSVATLDAFPKSGLKQAKAAAPQNESPNEPPIDPEQLENDRKTAANIVGYYLSEKDASVRERFGELVVAASSLIIFADQSGLDTVERNALVDAAIEALEQLKADSSQAELDEFVAKKPGPVAIAVGKIGLPIGAESYQLPPEVLTTGTDLGLLHLLELHSAQYALGGSDDTVFYDPQTYRDIQSLGLNVGLERAFKRMLAIHSVVPAEAIENALVRSSDIIELRATEALLGLDPVRDSEHLASTDPETYAEFTEFGRDVAMQRASKRLSVVVWEAPQWIVEDAEIQASDVVQFFTIAQQVELSDSYRLTRDNVDGENLYQRIKADGREAAYDYARKIAVMEKYSDKFNTLAIRTLVFDSGITGHQLLTLGVRDDYPIEKLADPEFYQKIANPNIGVEGAIAWANGRILGGGLLDRLKFEPIAAAFRATGLTGSLHSSGRIELQVGTASLTLGEILKPDATGNTTANLPAFKVNFDPTIDYPDATFLELHGITASIPLVEALPTATLEALSFSRRRLNIGELTLAKDDLDLDYLAADRISLTLPAQQIDFSDPLQLPKLDGVAFSLTDARILPNFGTNGLVEISQLDVRYESGTFLATVPQFDLEFGPFTTNIVGAELNLGLRNQVLPISETPILEVREATLRLKTDPTSDLTFTARRLRVLGGLDNALLPRVRFSSISLSSSEGIGDALGFGDILPLDITNLTIGTNAELDENDELLITATGKFNVDLLSDKLPFDPIIEIREQDTDPLPLILNTGGDGRITSNDDIDNQFSVSRIVGPNGL